MSSKKLILIAVVMLALLVLSTGLAFSQMAKKEKPTKPGLGLTPEQKEKVRRTNAISSPPDLIRIP